MKILLYAEGLKTIGKSGLGKAILHQKKALDYMNIPYTTDPHDDYDILHINTYFLKSYFLAKKAKKWARKLFIMHIPLKRITRMVLFLLNKLLNYLKKY